MSLKKSYPLASFDVHLDNFRHLSDTFRKNNDISRLINVLDENFWTLDLTNQVFHEDYDALVLTDQNQKIKWVSNGFSEMTGYTKKFALGKRPAFLQGS
jgi:PAS domain-containing protein